MAALQHTTRRALFAAAPALALVAVLPAVAAPLSPQHNFRRFIEWCDLGPAFDHALAQGFDQDDIYCIVCDQPDDNRALLFKSTQLGLATFRNDGRVK